MTDKLYTLKHSCNVGVHEAMWGMPMALAGWLIAQALKGAGVKGIARHVPKEKIMAALEVAKRQAKNGK